jgi:hypothetical protein
LVTVKGSHGLLTRALFVSPLYVPLKAKEPADGGATGSETGTELPAATVLVDVEAGVPVHTPPLKNA